jgi:uncharacterized protein (DUF1800 family)
LTKLLQAIFPTGKMTLMLHNHFVATHQKVKVIDFFSTIKPTSIWKTETTKQCNHNNDEPNKSNENLLIFTLGIGNYTEEEIKNGAKGLAGLTLGEESTVPQVFRMTHLLPTWKKRLLKWMIWSILF